MREPEEHIEKPKAELIILRDEFLRRERQVKDLAAETAHLQILRLYQ